MTSTASKHLSLKCQNRSSRFLEPAVARELDDPNQTERPDERESKTEEGGREKE